MKADLDSISEVDSIIRNAFKRGPSARADSVNKEVLDRFGDFLGMCFQREVAGVEETNGRIGNVAFKGLAVPGDAPIRQQGVGDRTQ